MPCFTPEPTVAELNARGKLTGGQIEAVMCGLLTNMEANDIPTEEVFNELDWKEIGVDRWDVSRWWATHKAADAGRRAKEAA
jgi:hypothetical protein